MRADLRRPVVLTEEQQQGTIEMLQDIDMPDVEEGSVLPDSQPFYLPVDCYERSTLTSPRVCKSRYQYVSLCNIIGRNA